MTRNQIHSIFLSAFVLVAAMIATRPAAAQDAKQPYPTMAPVEQYLMDRDAEIALARSAAPDTISHDASVTPPPDVLRNSERRCSLGRKSNQLPSPLSKLLVPLRRSLSTTQILPTAVRLPRSSRQMVRRHSRPTHVSKKLDKKETCGTGVR